MPKQLIFILGGARSGKSTYAQKLASELSDKVLFVATAEPLDEEMAVRIDRHRRERPEHWRTLEASHEVGIQIQLMQEGIEIVVVDCLTLLVSNVLLALGDSFTHEAADAAIRHELAALFRAYESGEQTWIVVSNEVGLGIVPMEALTRIYRDALGKANQKIAAFAGQVIWMVAGIPVKVKG